MDIREKLVEQLRWWATECDRTNCGCQASKLLVAAAKYIANNVKVQEWISVSEKLPNEKDGNKFGEVLVVTKNGDRTTYPYYMMENISNYFLYWMPLSALPTPPKGE